MSVKHSTAGPFTDYSSEEAAWLAGHVGVSPDTISSFTSDTGALLSTVTDSSTTKTIATTANSNAAADNVFPLRVRIQSGSGTLPKIQINNDGLWYPERNAGDGDVIKLRVTTPGSTSSTTVVRLYYPGGYVDWSVTTAAFTPASLTPYVWLSADSGVYNDAGTTLCTTGQTVRQWNDQSGNSRHFGQSTSGLRPTYTTSGQNGLPIVTFTTDDVMTLAPGSLANPFTIIVACKPGSGGQYVFDGDPYDKGGLSYSGGVIRHIPSSGSTITDSYTLGTATIFTVVNDGTASSLLQIRKTTPVTGSAAGSIISPWQLGGLTLGSYAMNGPVYELIVVDRAITSGERSDAQDYLISKWAI